MDSKTNPLVSILVPVYNVEKYIATCLDSLLAQSYPNIEIVLIDDGSPDRSIEICQEYAKKFPNIHVYIYENAGISTTRNRALDHANGDYYMFVDSDDYIHPKMVETMIRISQLDHSELVQCGYRMDYFKYFPFLRKVAKRQTINTIQALQQLVNNKGINNYPWGKLYKKEVFENVRFPEHLIGFEDTRTIFKTIANAETISTSPNRFYHYVQRQGSLTNRMDLETVYNMRKAYQYQEQVLKDRFPEQTFDFTMNYYNTDMVIIYTLIFMTYKKQNPKFKPYPLDWKKIPKVMKVAYYCWLKIACIKFGWNIDEIDWEQK